jgi:hypothetical protein
MSVNIFPPPPPPIVLPPSDDKTALVDAINVAAKSGRDLLLEPGVHYTKPGFRLMIPIGPQGLRMASFASSKSSAKATIRRPDHSVPPVEGSLSYGLFFIPSPPTDPEKANAVWKQAKDANGNTFEYAVVMRGAIDFGDLVVDCNMGNQDLETAVHDAAQHSAMISFSGFSFGPPFVEPGPDKIRRIMYIGFEKILVQDMEFLNGGYADDVLFPPGGGLFHPNIDQVVIQRVVSKRRLNPLRSTIDFTTPCANISIKDADIYQLHAESDADWKQAPRKDDAFTPSRWSLDNIKTQIMIFSVQGKVIQLKAGGLTVTEGCEITAAGGGIANSSLTIFPGENSRFFNLDEFSFEHTTLRLKAHDQGVVDGITLGCLGNTTCVASFENCKFEVDGGFSSGQLINTPKYSAAQPGNVVTADFRNCAYQSGFGTSDNLKAKVAHIEERGTWTFLRQDLPNGDPDTAIFKGPQPDIVLDIE